MPNTVAIVLPRTEPFSRERASDVVSLARRHAAPSTKFSSTVYGSDRTRNPIDDVPFVPVSATSKFFIPNGHYTRCMARALRKAPPDLIEVYDRMDLALGLARKMPGIPVTLVLSGDPVGAGLAAERQRLMDTLAGVACGSASIAERLTEGVPVPASPPVVLTDVEAWRLAVLSRFCSGSPPPI